MNDELLKHAKELGINIGTFIEPRKKRHVPRHLKESLIADKDKKKKRKQVEKSKRKNRSRL